MGEKPKRRLYKSYLGTVTATRWTTHGDHPEVFKFRPDRDNGTRCGLCYCLWEAHGLMDTWRGGHTTVCPLDYIIEDQHNPYPVPGKAFQRIYGEQTEPTNDQ